MQHEDELQNREERFRNHKNGPVLPFPNVNYISAVLPFYDILETSFLIPLQFANVPCLIKNASIRPSVADYLMVAAGQAHGNYENLTLLFLNATLGVIVTDPK